MAIKTARELVLLPRGETRGAPRARRARREHGAPARTRRAATTRGQHRSPRDGGRNQGWSVMKVLLRSDISGVGKKGDIVEVAKGFARNFLFPTGSALVATGGMEAPGRAMRKCGRSATPRTGSRRRPWPRCSSASHRHHHGPGRRRGRLFGSVDHHRRRRGRRGPDRRRGRPAQDPAGRAHQVRGHPRRRRQAARRGGRRADRRGRRRRLTCRTPRLGAVAPGARPWTGATPPVQPGLSPASRIPRTPVVHMVVPRQSQGCPRLIHRVHPSLPTGCVGQA